MRPATNTIFKVFVFIFFSLLYLLSGVTVKGCYSDDECKNSCTCPDTGNTYWCNVTTGNCHATCGQCSCNYCGAPGPWTQCDGASPFVSGPGNAVALTANIKLTCPVGRNSDTCYSFPPPVSSDGGNSCSFFPMKMKDSRSSKSSGTYRFITARTSSRSASEAQPSSVPKSPKSRVR